MASDVSCEYEDDDLLIKVPEYLRANRGMRVFKPHGRRQKDRQIFTLAVELVTDEGYVAAIRDAIRAAKPTDWMGVQIRIIRKGPTANVEGGYEYLSTSYNRTNGDTLHNYKVIFPLGRVCVHLFVGGRGELDAFEAVCQDIRSSIRLKSSETNDIVEKNRPDGSAAPRASVDPSKEREVEPTPGRTYLSAKPRIRATRVHSALILPDTRSGGVNLFLMFKQGEVLFPGGSSWHETEEAAKADALESLKIRHSDWVIHEGEPEWACTLKDAKEDAIEAYNDAIASDPPDE